MAGTLFVVATPIGNLEDLTFRALRVLREVDLIAAEDTRRTAKLLSRYEVRKPVVSLREHNEAREAPRLLRRLEAGQSIALVTDAGTPAVADPGARLVRAARDAGLPVIVVPGPSAITAALSISGLEAEQFVFMGFPPASGSARRAWMEDLAAEKRVVVFYEAPHRIERTLRDVHEMVNRPIVVHRELTKTHEHSTVYPNMVGVKEVQRKGEFTLVVDAPRAEAAAPSSHGEAWALFGRLTESAGFDREDAVRLIALHLGMKEREVRNAVKKAAIAAKRLDLHSS